MKTTPEVHVQRLNNHKKPLRIKGSAPQTQLLSTWRADSPADHSQPCLRKETSLLLISAVSLLVYKALAFKEFIKPQCE